MNRILAIFVGLVASLQAAEPPATLRVATWNLQWFPGGRIAAPKDEQDRQIELVREEIKKLKPDVILLQEVGSAAALEETLKPLGTEWNVAIVSQFKDGNFISGQQLAIAARIPAEAVWAETWEKGWAGPPRGYAYASFVVGGKRVAFYCLHLKSNLGDPPKNTSKREDAMEQLMGHVRTGRDRVQKPDAIIIAGDFNTDNPDTPAGQSPGERTFSMLHKEGFHWSFDGVAHQDRITCPGKGRYPDACFDQIFTKGLGKPISSVEQAKGSDHLPVIMEVAIPSRQRRSESTQTKSPVLVGTGLA
jgi:endonuclease/exonuclease/phosphatase family metal-dependent hydrolase